MVVFIFCLKYCKYTDTMANYPIHIYVDHIKRYWPISARTRTRNNWRTLRLIKCITNQLPTGQNGFCQTLVTKLLLTVSQPQSRSSGSCVWQNACCPRIQSINIYHCFRKDIASKRDPQAFLLVIHFSIDKSHSTTCSSSFGYICFRASQPSFSE